jgi:ribonuclease VapC
LIVVDTSALIAILISEEDGPKFDEFVRSRTDIIIGAPTKLEFLMVAIGRRGYGGQQAAKELLVALDIGVFEWTDAMSEIAIQAHAQFGKGQQHPAHLNFGDCMAYALAKSLNAPLLYKGGDFVLTDIKSAL